MHLKLTDSEIQVKLLFNKMLYNKLVGTIITISKHISAVSKTAIFK
jgi:hypothetical protein